MRPTFERLGMNVFEAPYVLDEYDFDYDTLNQVIKDKNIKFLNIAPSDILFPHDFQKIDDSRCVVLFDYSQLLGLIAAGLLQNPLDYLDNCILYGGTHKTMPGPAHGIIMTNNHDLLSAIDEEINPKYLRNVQTHQVISLLFCMIEMKYFGKAYQQNTVRMGNKLAQELTKRKIPVVHKADVFTLTHQLFLEMPEEKMNTFFEHAITEKITLNTKKKPLFHGGYGIRLGLQEISRYAWDNNALATIADILCLIAEDSYDRDEIKKLRNTLPPKQIHFTFHPEEYLPLLDTIKNI